MAARIYGNDGYFLYKGFKFLIMDETYSSPMDLREMEILRIVCPMPYMTDNQRYISVAYEKSMRSREEEVDRRTRACVRLATDFVMGVLPKVDYDIKKEITEWEIDRILEVLD